jgi:hypothetical protein
MPQDPPGRRFQHQLGETLRCERHDQVADPHLVPDLDGDRPGGFWAPSSSIFTMVTQKLCHSNEA